MIQLKRVYDPPEQTDGYRVLVDRVWPRGLSKRAANINAWLKEVAPSPELRKWFGHDPAKWDEFRYRYKEELGQSEPNGQIDHLVEKAREGTTTLLFAAKDREHNNAVVLKEVLEERA